MKKFIIASVSVLFILSTACFIFINKKNIVVREDMSTESNEFTDVEISVKNTKVIVALKVDEYAIPVELEKWNWTSPSRKEPDWFRGYLSVNDPRKFVNFQEYSTFITTLRRTENKKHEESDFNKWRSLVNIHEKEFNAMKPTIHRAVYLKHLDHEYVYISNSQTHISLVTKENETCVSVVFIKKEGNIFKAAHIDEFEFMVNPNSVDKIRTIIKSKKAQLHGKFLYPIE